MPPPEGTSGPAAPTLGPATALPAVVAAVDTQRHLVDVRLSVGRQSTVRGVRVLVPWAASGGDSGVYVLPQVGDHVLYLREGHTGARGFVIGGFFPQVAGGRSPAALIGTQPGEVVIRAADGPVIRLRPSGGLELEAGALCGVSLDPRTEEVSVCAASLRVETAGLSVLAETRDVVEDEGGEYKTSVSIGVRARASDDYPTLQVRCGAPEDSEVFRASICSPSTGEELSYIAHDEAGAVRLGAPSVHAEIPSTELIGDVDATGDVSLTGDMAITGDVSVAGDVVIAADGEAPTPVLNPASLVDIGTVIGLIVAPLGLAAEPAIQQFLQNVAEAAAGRGAYVTARLRSA